MVKIKKRPFSVAVGILVILTAILIIVFSFEKGKKDEKYVLYINDYGITKEEYIMLAKEYCNQVYMKYTTEQVNSEKFWTEKIDGTAPYTVLEDIILEELKENYALKTLAIDLDIVEDYTYNQLIQEKDKTNENSEYGLNEYSESTYYKYWYSNLETQVRNALISEEVHIPEKECQKYYDENKDSYVCDIEVDIWYAEIQNSLESSNKAFQLSKAMNSFKSIKELSAEEYFADVEFQELKLSSIDTQEGMSGIYSKRWEIASKLTEEEICSPYKENGVYCVIKCVNREENKIIEFESVYGQIERYLQTKEVKRIIEEQIEKLNIRTTENRTKDIILENLK